MRVISGIRRGLKLDSLDGLDTRPTLDRVKESIFSMIFEIPGGARVLDLFAGSGGMGIEALSRGSEFAVFVDRNAAACNVVRANLKKCGFESKASVINSDCFRYLENAGKSGERFDIIFLDPPYALGLLDDTLKKIHDLELLNQDGIVVVEFDDNTDVDIRNYKLLKSKRYGRVCVNILGAE